MAEIRYFRLIQIFFLTSLLFKNLTNLRWKYIFQNQNHLKNEKIKSGFTIIEVTIASVIFAIAAAGILATITAMRRPAEVSQERVTAAYLGKTLMEELRSEVNASTWDPSRSNASNLRLGNHRVQRTVDGVTYNLAYTISELSNNGPRRMDLTITW
ncbi:MAG: prepilin-type N-terminal cleavage/methylation domain-containing protein [Saprospiraceae bacterium]|nr:prepilin-type N-terminal cleavage/methylation domain-containing protein [Saprospiraceae bacterium]